MTTAHSDEPQHPARAVDYALINVSYISALAGIGVVLRRQGSEVDLSPREVVLLTLATFSLADVFAHERIATWIRQPFDVETADHRPGRPRGQGAALRDRRADGVLALPGLVVCTRLGGPAGGIASRRGAVTTVLAAGGANDFLQAVFRLLKDRVDQIEAAT